MGSVMAQQFQRVFMVAGHDLHSGVGFDRAREIAQFAIDLDRKRGFGEARTNIGGERRARHRAVEIRTLPSGSVIATIKLFLASLRFW